MLPHRHWYYSKPKPCFRLEQLLFLLFHHRYPKAPDCLKSTMNSPSLVLKHLPDLVFPLTHQRSTDAVKGTVRKKGSNVAFWKTRPSGILGAVCEKSRPNFVLKKLIALWHARSISASPNCSSSLKNVRSIDPCCWLVDFEGLFYQQWDWFEQWTSQWTSPQSSTAVEATKIARHTLIQCFIVSNLERETENTYWQIQLAARPSRLSRLWQKKKKERCICSLV